MEVKNLIKLYKQDSIIQTIAERIKPDKKFHLHLKGLIGSLDAVIATSVCDLVQQKHLFVLQDKEEAIYFLNDLQNLINEKGINSGNGNINEVNSKQLTPGNLPAVNYQLPAVLLFPDSYKRSFELDQVDNANIQMRVEVLSKISQVEDEVNLSTANSQLPAVLIVTYPEAITEKVINKNTLKKNTFQASVGDKVNTTFISELLAEYDFEKSDFVYEAGQFAIRGGIIDIYSYANDMPYRIELYGNEIESIRIFDPETQLSLEKVKQISIIPNTQIIHEGSKGSFFEFLPDDTKIWLKDVQFTLDIINKADFQSVEFETADNILEQLRSKVTIEFGKQFYFDSDETFTFDAAPQPSFHKDFKLLTVNLKENQSKGLVNIITAESSKQTERLATIFEELDPFVKFHSINISLREGFIDKRLNFLEKEIEGIEGKEGKEEIEEIEEIKEIEEIEGKEGKEGEGDGKVPPSGGFSGAVTGIACYTDHQIFDRFHKHKIKTKHYKSTTLTLKELKTLQPGDFVTHVDFGIGRFAGLDIIEVKPFGNNEEKPKMQEVMRIIYKNDDLLYVNIHSLHKISKYYGKDGTPPISRLGSKEWINKKKRVKNNVKDIAKDLIQLYAKRKAAPGFAFSEDNFMQAELESSFLYEDTPDQAKATADTKRDMQSPHPMDRLVCGDVGFGKTEVAIRAAFKACCESKQVALLVPTTILAMQHYNTFTERLQKFPCNIEYVNRFKSSKKIKEILNKISKGEIDILIGTHRIISKDVKFKDLGLLIIDEEQKFGVAIKEKLKQLKVNVDTLTLTATPIPRTLHFSLMGARDLSIINTPPANRKPITTRLHTFKKGILMDNDNILRDAINFELQRGGQVFFVHNRIRDIEEIAAILQRMVPDAQIAVTHGKMEGNKLENEMLKFIKGDYDLLVSTSIIENGLDIPNANTIIINMAHLFGLSDLHQMRGRVGRSNKKAFCYFITPPLSNLSLDARKRLSSLEEFSDLGDGFNIAMRDLDIRGSGNLLGADQSGFINELGFDMYHKVLDEAIEELKIEMEPPPNSTESEKRGIGETERGGQFTDSPIHRFTDSVRRGTSDCIIETDFQMLIPEEYVSNVAERLKLYSELDSIKKPESLNKFKDSLIDRFGPIPDEVHNLIKTLKLRWKAKELGFEKLILKNEMMKGYFIGYGKREMENGKWRKTSSASSTKNLAGMEDYYQSETFGKIIQYAHNHPKYCNLKEINGKRSMIFDEIKTVDQALEKLDAVINGNKEIGE